MRAFFAVDLPSRLTEPIADTQALFEDAAGLRFVDPEQAHVTLKFLGDVGAPDDADDPDDSDNPDDATPALADVIAAGTKAIETAGAEPFECAVNGLGVFPSLEYISVVWAGVGSGSTALTTLHEAVETETTQIGVDPDDHAFTPHVTLARMNDARGKERVQKIVRERDPTIGRFEADAVRLMSSTLTSEGPVYDTVATFELE